jgi:isocitrate dehydrogenase
VESGQQAEDLGPGIEEVTSGLPARLKMISSRGTKVYPSMGAMTDYVDHWRCRFIPAPGESEVSDETITTLMHRIATRYRWMHVEKLQEFDGEPAFSKAQGED